MSISYNNPFEGSLINTAKARQNLRYDVYAPAGIHGMADILPMYKVSASRYALHVTPDAYATLSNVAVRLGLSNVDYIGCIADGAHLVELSARLMDYLASGYVDGIDRVKRGVVRMNETALNKGNALRATRYNHQGAHDSASCDCPNLYTLAIMAARRAVKTVVNKECTPRLIEIQQELSRYRYDIVDSRAALGDAADLVQVAAMAIIERVPANWQSYTDTTGTHVNRKAAEMLAALTYHRITCRDSYGHVPPICMDVWRAAVRAVRNSVSDHAANKGRKAVRVVRSVPESACTVIDAQGNRREVVPKDTSGARRRVTLDSHTGYAVELVSLSDALGQPERYAEYEAAQRDGGASYAMQCADAYMTFVQTARGCMADDTRQMLQLAMDGYTVREIAGKTGDSKSKVDRDLRTARRALAESDAYRDSPYARAYLGLPVTVAEHAAIAVAE